MESISYPLRIPSPLLELAEIRAREEYVDKTTAIKQLLYSGAEDYVVELLKRGRISIGKASELLGKNIYEMQDILEEKHVETGASLGQFEQAIKKHKQKPRAEK